MPASVDHKKFPQPTDEDVFVWRYMSLEKFLDLISTRSIYFSRSDLLGDPYEGSYPRKNVEIRSEIYKQYEEKVRKMMIEDMPRTTRKLREFVYVNCWNMSEYESAAMWDLYGRSGGSVAIRTTYSRLRDTFPGEVNLGLINYIDYDIHPINEGNILVPFMHKRKSFSHESEIRGVILKFPEAKEGIDILRSTTVPGLRINIDIDKLVESVFVSPACPDWILGVVESVSKKFELKVDIKRSSIDADPVY